MKNTKLRITNRETSNTNQEKKSFSNNPDKLSHKINDFLIKIGINYKIKESELRKCLESEKTQELILKERIKAQKEYNITSTPTIYINDKKYEDKHKFKSFKRQLDKLL